VKIKCNIRVNSLILSFVYHTGPFLDYFVKSQFLLRVPLALARCIIYERRYPMIKIKTMPCNSELRKSYRF